MKKSLMATTALVAASVAVSGAYAQDDEMTEEEMMAEEEMMEEKMMAEPVSLSIGGYAAWGVSLSSHESERNSESLGIASSIEVQFKGKTVLDNGLEVGVRVELEGEQQRGASGSTKSVHVQNYVDHDEDPDTDPIPEVDEMGNPVLKETKLVDEVSTSSDQIDEAYVYVSGSFGEIRVGNDDEAAYIMSAQAPQATSYYGANSPSWTGTASPLFFTTLPGEGGGDAASVFYFTPVVNGFQFGVSYAPESGGGVDSEARNNVAPNKDGGEKASAAFNYNGSISEGTGLVVAAGVVNISDDGTADSEDTTDVAAGMKLSRGAYAIGGSYRSTDDGSDEPTITYEMGAQYSSGPWGVSLNWSHQEDDDDATKGGDIYRLLGSYSLGAGVTLSGALGMDQPEDNAADDTHLLGMAMSVAF